MNSPTGLPNRPLSVKEISEKAQDFKLNTNIPLKAWIRTAHTLHHEGDVYFHEANFAQAYLLYLRYSILVMDCLPKHPEYKTPDGKKAAKKSLLTLPSILSILEKIKPLIEREHQAWQASESSRKAAHQRIITAPSEFDVHASRDPALSSAAKLLDVNGNQDLAVDLAQQEIRRRRADREATRKAGLSREEEQNRRIAGFWDNWTSDLVDQEAEEEDLFRGHMEATRRQLDSGGQLATEGSNRTIQNSRYHYPTIARSEPVHFQRQPAEPRSRISYEPPGRPPKESYDLSYQSAALPPELPAKEHIYRPTSHDLEGLQPGVPPKIPDRPTASKSKEQRVTFLPSAYLENGEPLRSIMLPRGLRTEFLSIASENTKRGLEMCGILCGTAVNNVLVVQCLLIPEQKCTSDTCETENEGAMLEFCMNADLLMLGWIHTHPTQTCFMSSRDLHTQSGYQVMLPESIAIVCAPKFEPSYGIFRLTNPPGLPNILSCTQSSTFHPHSVDNLYTGAKNPPGHVFENENLGFTVEDLRPGYSNGK